MLDFKRKISGHNLLEAVLAGIIFSTIAVFLMGIWDMQFQAMLKSKEMSIASFLAERTMEECLGAGFEQVENLYPIPTEFEVRTRTRAGEVTVKYESSVSVTNHPVDSHQKVVEVSVKFNDSTGERTVDYHSTVHENG